MLPKQEYLAFLTANKIATGESRIGFGIGGFHDESNTCGNGARDTSDNGHTRIKAMGIYLDAVAWK